MSQNISSTLPSINHNDHFQARQHFSKNRHHHSDQSSYAGQDSYHKTNEDLTTKAFTSLTNTLTRAFTSAVKVNPQTGEEETTRGGLQRVGKDLQKMFKGIGFPPQMAKQYARDISSAMGQEGVEQINFTLETTRSLTVSAYNQSGTATNVTDESGAGISQASGFQLSAIQTQSFDVSINLTTGEFSLNRSYEERVTLSTLTATSQEDSELLPMLAGENVEGTPQEKISDQGQEVEQAEPDSLLTPLAVNEDTAKSLIEESLTVTDQNQVDAMLFQLSHSISQSALFTQQQLADEANAEETETEQAITTNNTFYQLQLFAERTLQINFGETSLFESMTNISNFRIETIDQQEYLSFTVQATAPVGLTAVDKDGSSSTVYPRLEGGIGEITTADSATSA